MILRSDKRYYDVVKKHKPLVIFSDPIDRFVSTLNVYFTENNKYTEYGKDIFASLGYNMLDLNPSEKVNIIMLNFNAIKSKHQSHHFNTQCSFLDRESFSKFEVIKKSDVTQKLGIKNIHNETKKEITVEHLSENQLQFIKNMYKEDYEFLKEYNIL